MKQLQRLIFCSTMGILLSFCLSCTIDPALTASNETPVELEILNYSSTDRTDKITIGIGHIDSGTALFSSLATVEFFERNAPNPTSIELPAGTYDLAWKFYLNGDWQPQWSFNDSCYGHYFAAGQQYRITYYNSSGQAIDVQFVVAASPN